MFIFCYLQINWRANSKPNVKSTIVGFDTQLRAYTMYFEVYSVYRVFNFSRTRDVPPTAAVKYCGINRYLRVLASFKATSFKFSK